MKKGRNKFWKVCGGLLLCILCMGVSQVEASYEGIPNITMSQDGNAFTTNAGDKETIWYEKGTTVDTGVTGTVGEPKVGEHIYSKNRVDHVPVGKWVVAWEQAKCVHDEYPSGDLYYGESFGKQNCNESYYSGWLGYCADCGDAIISRYIYMSEQTARKLTYLDMSKAYYYKCPHCDNLEQGVALTRHVCKGISANRYFVRYHANLGTGTMVKSVHMVNNSTIYEGQEITPQMTLNLNSYTRKGYEFAGWNTKRDGSGQSFEDGGEIYNLSLEQNANVVLYAQWKKCDSVLEIDPAGGNYEGKSGIAKIEGGYGEEYSVDSKQLKAPRGYTIHFDTQGGETIGDMEGTMRFQEWSCSQPLYGKWKDNVYCFGDTSGVTDRLTAIYSEEAIILPEAVREGYAFGGWFSEKECTNPVGMPGGSYIPKSETTLYACWVQLQLVSEDNYTANQGKGAVDLSWSQKDSQDKVYQIYQKTDATDWEQISSAEEVVDTVQVSQTIAFSEEEGNYTVPYTGFYRLTLTGAQGGNYGIYQGGKGGLVQAEVYLKKGEKIEYVIGGQNGFWGGGTGNTYGNGGGFSCITTDRYGVLLVAGGGGGASDTGDGGEGGSAAQVHSMKEGQRGEAGGGGGFQGGVCGKSMIHTHAAECKHVHIGTSTVYGGCYTKSAPCGSTDILKKEDRRVFYYGNIADDGSHKFCERCGSHECPGHLNVYYKYVCNVCGNSSAYEKKICGAITAYEPSCGYGEGFLCGMEEGQVISSEPAYGGSSYVNVEYCNNYSLAPGVQSGNGQLVITSLQVGLVEENRLKGVMAPDFEKPDEIDVSKIVKTAVDLDKLRISFPRPEDNGTAYYHKVESYFKTTNEYMCTSNQTKNTLVSGIIGYYYAIDRSSQTIMNDSHTFYAEKGEAPFVLVDVEDAVKYLHIAAVDVAGNIGPTCHIALSNQDVIYWPLMTEKLQLEEGSNIYPVGKKDTYYVRADNSTPFALTLEGLLCGTARENYQINHASFLAQNLSNSNLTGQLTIITPNQESVAAGVFTYPMKQLQKQIIGELCLQDASYTVTKRHNQCKSLTAVQKFTLSQDYDEQCFQVIPQVAAVENGEAVYSNREQDLDNSLFLIADGVGPIITGTDALQNLKLEEYSDGKRLELEFEAKDFGSGLAKFYVEVCNRENGIIERYANDLAGRIQLIISDENELFQGEFTVTVYASDNVGNETSIQNELSGIGLTAHVERVLAPHTPVFKRGESGVLFVETIGYVERIEVCFPTAFESADSSLDRSFVYEVPSYIQTEEIPFIVPINVPDGELTIQVKGYKAGTELEAEPKLVTIRVKGSILDELRTRLR